MVEKLSVAQHAEFYEGRKIYRPEVVVLPNSEAVDKFSAGIVAEQIYKKPNSILTLPTGSTPIGMYRLLAEMHNKGLGMSGLTTANLDEYVGIPRSHPESYDSFMRRNLFDNVNIPESQRHIPDCEAVDPDMEALRYQKVLNQIGTRDLAVLGIGPELTCHIGFNERGSTLDSRVRVVQIDPVTIEANSRFFESPEQVPHEAITQGVADILNSKRIILLAKGRGKAPGIQRTLEGEIGPDAPASFLRLHPNVTFIIDQEAASLLHGNS
jgi:glucosamine-6-phosphate deaminase